MLQRSRLSLTVVFLTVAVLLIYQALSPLGLSSSTYVAAAVLLAGMGIVTVLTAGNAPTGSVGQLLYETEKPQVSPRVRRSRQVRGW